MIYIYNEQIKLDGYVAMVLEAQLNSLLRSVCFACLAFTSGVSGFFFFNFKTAPANRHVNRNFKSEW